MNEIRLRPATLLDEDFLATLYAQSRAEELAASDWPAAAAQAFLVQQRAAQEAHYRNAYPASSHDIVLSGARSVGRLWVDRDARRILIVDISLLATERGRGIGTLLIERLVAEADAVGVTVELSVATQNARAASLYRRIGFAEVDRSPTNIAMRHSGR